MTTNKAMQRVEPATFELSIDLRDLFKKLHAEAAKDTATALAHSSLRGQEEIQAAAGVLRESTSHDKGTETIRVNTVKPLNDAVKAINAGFKAVAEERAVGIRHLKSEIQKGNDLLEKERRRIEAEAQERARKEREKLEARAAKAAETGKVEVAEALQEQAETVQAPVRAKHKAPTGLSTRTLWSAEVTDKMALIKAVAAGQAPHTLLEVNMTVLNKQAQALKDAMVYPGVKAVSRKSMAVRS